MPTCKHAVLTLMPPAEPRLRCQHCHLTISSSELGSSYCPECLEVHKVRRQDFEEVSNPAANCTRYRCEACGLILDV